MVRVLDSEQFRKQIELLLEGIDEQDEEYKFVIGDNGTSIGVTEDPNSNIAGVDATLQFPLDLFEDSATDSILNANKFLFSTLLIEENGLDLDKVVDDINEN